MGTELDITAQTDPLYAVSLKGYDTNEVDNLLLYVDQTITWLQDKNVYTSTEDVISLRVGVPYLGSDESVDANTVYTSNDELDRVIASIGLDFIKITTYKNDTSPVADQLVSYTYKSPYIHRIFGDYFVDGVNNKSGLLYMDGYDISGSRLATAPVVYNGVVQNIPIIPEAMPNFVVYCLQ